MKKITGILVDVETGVARKATIKKSLEGYYNALRCDLIDIVGCKIGGIEVEVICDDEALLKQWPTPSAFDSNRNPILAGNIFVCKFDGKGDLESLPDAVADLILRLAVRKITRNGKTWHAIFPCNYC